MLKLLDVYELAPMLGRSPETIKKDLKRNPVAVPPRLHIPGTRLLRWRQSDVDSWLAQFVIVQIFGEPPVDNFTTVRPGEISSLFDGGQPI